MGYDILNNMDPILKCLAGFTISLIALLGTLLVYMMWEINRVIKMKVCIPIDGKLHD